MTVWSTKIYFTQTGSLEFEFGADALSDADWETRLTGRGKGEHTVPLFEAGISQADIREYTRGNRYTITQQWGDYVAFAGVLQNRHYVKKTRAVKLTSVELRGAYLNDRMLFGVPAYNAAGGAATVLSIAGKSRAGAVRAVLDMATNLNSEWNFPLDLPADGSGGFWAEWLYSDRLKVEDHLKQIENDGCEIYLRPYIAGTDLRWAVEVDSPITYGSETVMPSEGDDSPVIDLEVDEDYVKQMTGVLAFGDGGKSAIARHAPTTGTGASEIGVRDTWVTFPDITDETRLQSAADSHYDALKDSTEGWSFGLHVFPDGPEVAAPGSLLGLVSSGDEFIPDGTHHKRVVALKGGLGTVVIPEVQNAS